MTAAEAEKVGRRPEAEPDHPFRHTVGWVLFDRAWRPLAGWVVIVGILYAGVIGPWIDRPLGEAALAIWLGFAAAVLGLRTVEKARGVA